MCDRAVTVEEQVLALATKRDIEAAGGLEVCAAETGLSTSQLSRCSSRNHRDSLTVRDAATIGAIGTGAPGSPFVLHALARLAGKLVIDGPGTVTDAACVQAGVIELVTELGDFARAVGAAVADGKWTPREVEAALTELDHVDAVSAATRGKLMAIKRGIEGERA
jgi:hypothetical protein